MSEWEPATDAERAMRDALRTDDQESYFRILADVDLLLPVSADALAGLAPLGWGTWSTGGRTHVLAFTSPSALQACLADYTGSARRVAYNELAETWPNLEWWLAVNPGLPIEGYLPAWFVAQLSRGDVRLPKRPARDGQDVKAAAMATPGSSQQGGPMPPGAMGAPGPVPASAGGFRPGGAAFPPGNGAVPDLSQPDRGQVPTPGAAAAAALGSRAAAAAAGGGPSARPISPADAPTSGPAAAPSSGVPAPTSSAPQQALDVGAPIGPGGLPIRNPGGVLPSGLPSRVPAADTPAASVSGAPPAPVPSGPPVAPGAPGPGVPAPYRAPNIPASSASGPPSGPSNLAAATGALAAARGQKNRPPTEAGPPPSAVMPTRAPARPTDSNAPLPTRTPMAQTPPLPGHIATPPPVPDLAHSSGTLPRRTPSTPMDPGAHPGSGFIAPVVPGAPGGPPPGTGMAPQPETPPVQDRDPDFAPANPTERDLLAAADDGSTDSFLSTLLLATVLIPVADESRPGSSPGESGFVFRTEEMDGGPFLVVFTSRDRLSEHYHEPARTVAAKFLDLIHNWPDPAWSFAVNPNSPVGAKYPGSQVIALASWATEAGLGADQDERRDEKPAAPPQRATDAGQHATVMQKTVPTDQVDYYLERGYDRVAGFVHRANEVDHLRTPGELFAALGLVHEGSAHTVDAKEAYVLRWPAYRPSLYRIPYGGQSEQALRAMDGWVIERPPFRGNGFAPGEGRDVIAEFKVDSVRLPQGAQLWRMDADGSERCIAIFDADAPIWRRVGEQ